MNEIEAIGTIGSYNGYKRIIKELYNYIAYCETTSSTCNFPDFLSDNPDNYDRIIWSIIVLKYGDYGTSPRFGWIESVHEAKIYLKELLGYM